MVISIKEEEDGGEVTPPSPIPFPTGGAQKPLRCSNSGPDQPPLPAKESKVQEPSTTAARPQNLKRRRSGGDEPAPKFSISLSRKEIEEDWLLITGNKLPNSPKKRPRPVQDEIDKLFPGSRLSEITADKYKTED